MATTDIHFDNFKIYRSAKECILRLQIQQWSTFMSAAPLDSGYFDQKLQDPSLLILRSSFSCGRSCRTFFTAIRSSLSLRRNSKKQRKSTHACLAHEDPGYHEKLQTLGICFFAPPFFVGEIVGPLLEAIWSCLSLMGHSSAAIFLSILVVFFSKIALTSIFFSFVVKT